MSKGVTSCELRVTGITRYPLPVTRYSKKGFTLVELIMVMAIIAVLSAMVLPRYNRGTIIHLEVATAAREITSDLRYTRHLAIDKAENHRLTIYPDTHEYRIFDSSDTQIGETKKIPSNITCSGTTEFIFQPLGNATGAGTLSLTKGGYQYDISVLAATGKVTVTEVP